MAKKIALGKGIASLIQDSPSEVIKEAKAQLEKTMRTEDRVRTREELETNPYLVDVTEIRPNPNQPRKIFKQKELEELSASIEQNGIIQPLIVTKSTDSKGFELIAGERRLRAAKMAGLTKVPVVIKKTTARDQTLMAIIENIQRADLNCVEEALAYYQVMEEYQLNQEELAKKLGKERSSVANYLRILKLPREVVELVQKDHLSFGHAKILAAIKERETAIRFANIAVRDDLTVRELEKMIKKGTKAVSDAKGEHKDDRRWDELRQKLEERTGFHFHISPKKNGAGQFSIKYSNEAEFNDIYEYLLKRP